MLRVKLQYNYTNVYVNLNHRSQNSAKLGIVIVQIIKQRHTLLDIPTPPTNLSFAEIMAPTAPIHEPRPSPDCLRTSSPHRPDMQLVEYQSHCKFLRLLQHVCICNTSLRDIRSEAVRDGFLETRLQGPIRFINGTLMSVCFQSTEASMIYCQIASATGLSDKPSTQLLPTTDNQPVWTNQKKTENNIISWWLVVIAVPRIVLYCSRCGKGAHNPPYTNSRATIRCQSVEDARVAFTCLIKSGSCQRPPESLKGLWHSGKLPIYVLRYARRPDV